MLKAKTQSLIALSYFLIAALLGITLRLYPTININANYKFIVHTHSHIALLGWVYLGLTTLIFHLFIKEEAKNKYSTLFVCTQVTILGMLFSFPITGYALFSILFSTLFLICSYWFYAFFRKNNTLKKNSIIFKFINTALIFMILSSLGPWALGAIMNTLGNTSHWYKNAIYFYLHFQYNGWFICCLLGVFFFFLEKNNFKGSKKTISVFYKLMTCSCVLTVFLSFLWTNPPKIIYLLAFTGVILQLFAFLKFHQIIIKNKPIFKENTSLFSYNLFVFIYFLFCLKIGLQSITIIPYFTTLASQILNFVIGYLHLIFLGVISLSILFLLDQTKLLKISKNWVLIFLAGFIFSETLIFYKGFCNWQQISIIKNYYSILALVSAFMPLGILGILISNTNLKTTFLSQQKSL